MGLKFQKLFDVGPPLSMTVWGAKHMGLSFCISKPHEKNMYQASWKNGVLPNPKTHYLSETSSSFEDAKGLCEAQLKEWVNHLN